MQNVIDLSFFRKHTEYSNTEITEAVKKFNVDFFAMTETLRTNLKNKQVMVSYDSWSDSANIVVTCALLQMSAHWLTRFVSLYDDKYKLTPEIAMDGACEILHHYMTEELKATDEMIKRSMENFYQQLKDRSLTKTMEVKGKELREETKRINEQCMEENNMEPSEIKK
jgi:hypothetical protein